MESYLSIYFSIEQYALFQAGKEAIATNQKGEHDIGDFPHYKEEMFYMSLSIPISYLIDIDVMEDEDGLFFYIILKKDEKQHK